METENLLQNENEFRGNKKDCVINLISFRNFLQEEMKNCSRLYAHLDAF